MVSMAVEIIKMENKVNQKKFRLEPAMEVLVLLIIVYISIIWVVVHLIK